VRGAAGKGGRLRNAAVMAGRGLGGAMGIAAAGLFAVELAKGVRDTLGDLVPSGKGRPQIGNPDSGGWNLWNVVKDAVGDGAGKVAKGMSGGLPSGGAFGGDLMGARPAMRPFAAIGSRFGLGVSSGKRPGAITSSGNQSWHSTGEAIDMSGPSGGMMNYFKAMKSRFGNRLSELIYTPGGAGIKDGRPYTYGGQVAADHYDHVHVAFDSGQRGIGDGIGQIKNLWTRAGGSASKANLAAAVAMAESSGNAGASNRNSDGSVDRGLWQINSIHGALSTFDRLANARAAVQISSGGRDWSPWVAYKSGAYRKFLGAGGGGGRSSGGGSGGSGGARDAFNRSQSAGRRASAGAERSARGKSGPGDFQGYEGTLATIGLAKANADTAPEMMKALYEEAFAKKTRLRKIKRALKRRLKPATRTRLTEEAAALIVDLKEIGALFKEYAANGMGADGGPGSPAEAGEVAEPEAGPTATDFANAAIAEASLTPGLDDDIKATEALLGIATGDLNAARASGDPRRIAEAIAAWKSVKDSLDALKNVVDIEAETRQRLIDATESLAAEVKTQNEFSRSVAGIATTQAVRALADMINGQIYGPLAARRNTAGNGAVVAMP
jgi:hypothetical protein